MQSLVTTVQAYLDLCPVEQKDSFLQLRNVIVEHLPLWFEECINYGMIGYVVPHLLYPDGYHCDPKLPLPFLWLAYQKNSINFYHMGIYADDSLLEWFQSTRSDDSTRKLDMGKSCMRFKYYHEIPYALIGELVEKMSVQEWITLYENKFKKK
jgi:hypothetical protein